MLDQGMAEVCLYHVPPESRYGPWQRRPWAVWATNDGRPKIEVIPLTEILCKVILKDGALDIASLTTLSGLGVDVGSMPHRDHSLPPTTF